MKTLVELIGEVEENLKELQEAEKKTGKALLALEQERKDIMANIAMFEKVLANLTGTKEKEIVEVMAKKPEQKSGNRPIRAKSVNAIDANGEVIAVYRSQTEAAKDLGLDQSGASWRMRNMSKDSQLKKFGYALVFA